MSVRKCDGITCLKHQSKRSMSGIRYEGNEKRCSECQLNGIFIKWDGLFCPCCGSKLKTRNMRRNNPSYRKKKQCNLCKGFFTHLENHQVTCRLRSRPESNAPIPFIFQIKNK